MPHPYKAIQERSEALFLTIYCTQYNIEESFKLLLQPSHWKTSVPPASS
jgi:hypothetical protein